MLGTAIQQELTGVKIFPFASKNLDITCAREVHEKLNAIKPDYIINCAAYTAVDRAESDSARCYEINATAVQHLAQVAKHLDATLIHFSTDYVFDGTATRAYEVEDATNPINIYGASKLAGEQGIKLADGKFYIFRISWLYAAHGKNFFKWVLENNAEELNIVSTQIGSPTSANCVADFISNLLENDPIKYGTYHFVNKGEVSWYAFAKAIKEKAALKININPVDHFPTAAQRPSYSVMECQQTEEVFDYKIDTVEGALLNVIKRVEQESVNRQIS